MEVQAQVQVQSVMRYPATPRPVVAGSCGSGRAGGDGNCSSLGVGGGSGPVRYRRSGRRRPSVAATIPLEDATELRGTPGAVRRFRRQRRRRKRVTFRDEVTNMSLVENESPIHQIKIPEKKAVLYQYTREELMVIKSRPLSKIRPGCLDPAFNNPQGFWDPDIWHEACKRSVMPPDDERGGRGDASSESHKRRSGDPRERLRKEQEGIVLSPQRRSFNSGCCVAQQVGKRPESPLGKNERDLVHRDMPARRIGSGRIPPRDMWDFRESDPSTDFIFRPPANREREERRSFGREFERERERDRTKDRHRNNREDRSNYSDRRRAHSDSHEEEPEWFSGGPTSQHDTIELRGFEDIPEEQGGTRENRKQSGRSKNNRSGSGNKKTADTSSSSSSAMSSNTSGSTQSGPGGRSTPTLGTVAVPLATLPSPITVEDGKSFKDSLSTKSPNTTAESSLAWREKKEDGKDQSDFNLDDFLKGDAIPGLLTNGATAEGPAGSRFSQWFRRESPVNKQTDSRRSSVHEELLSNMLGEATGKLHSVEELEAKMRQGISSNKTSNKKSDEDLSAFNKLLAQVSDGKAIPATVTNGPIPSKPQSMNFLQMLSKSQQEANIQSVARPVTAMRPADVGISSVNPLSGFGALSQQNIANNAVPPGLTQTQSQQMQIPQDLVLKLLQVQQQQQKQQQQQQQQQRQQQHHHHHHNHNQHHQQHQQELLSKLFAAGQQSLQGSRLGPMGPQFSIPPPPSLSPLPPELQVMVANAQPSRELLQRPEAKAILQGLRYGEITPQHLVQQLQNPAMQHRHREVLVSILKMQMQQGASPRTVSPHQHPPQPDLLHQIMLQQQQQQHQQQQLRIPSPLNSVLPRVPSPRELIAHTQNIMQSALIKKKLEEQRENYRKRQEMQQSLSPSMPGGGAGSGSGSGSGVKVDSSSPAKHMSSPTPLAFTPTSVLRKMTAEKESEATNMTIGIRTEAKNSGGGDQIKPLASQSQQQYNHMQQHQMRQQSGGLPPRSQQSGGIQWNMPKHQQGRAIVKGNTYQYGSNIEYQQQQQLQQHHPTSSQQQQSQQQQSQQSQQQRHNSVIGSSGSNNGNYSNMSRSKMPMTTPQTNLAAVPQQFNSLMMMHRPSNQSSSARAQTLQAHFASLQQQQQQQRHQNNLGPSLQQLLMNQNFGASHSTGKSDSRMQRGSQPMPVRQGQNAALGSSSSADLSTSPTTNQLARWFTRAGQLPDMPSIPSTQKILSLEELERHQQSSAAVHN